MLKNIILVSFLILISNAWWDKGHMLVSQIAYNHLTQTNRIDARDQFDKLITAFNPFTDGKTQDFVEAAVWADDIKTYGANFFDSYHFINM